MPRPPSSPRRGASARKLRTTRGRDGAGSFRRGLALSRHSRLSRLPFWSSGMWPVSVQQQVGHGAGVPAGAPWPLRGAAADPHSQHVCGSSSPPMHMSGRGSRKTDHGEAGAAHIQGSNRGWTRPSQPLEPGRVPGPQSGRPSLTAPVCTGPGAQQ